MTFDEVQAQYIAGLRAVLANDPLLGPLIAERDAAIAQNNAAQVSSLNNQIRNTAASDDALKAVKALRDLRLGA